MVQEGRYFLGAQSVFLVRYQEVCFPARVIMPLLIMNSSPLFGVTPRHAAMTRFALSQHAPHFFTYSSIT